MSVPTLMNPNKFLFDSISERNYGSAMFSLQNGADVNAVDEHGWPALISAVHRNMEDLALRLINMGADLNLTNRQGNTAFIQAAIEGNLSALTMLAERGADINIKNSEGNTALIEACRAGISSVETSRYLLTLDALDATAKNNAGINSLMGAANNGNHALVSLLLPACKQDINAQNEEGDSALMMSSYWGYTNIVQDLITHGADVYLANNEGMLSLDIAIERKHEDVASLLTQTIARDHQLALSENGQREPSSKRVKL